ncbi:hypothetical protein GCM10012284_40370 [Mangrovihabitans endophyticus]|uniref:F5/8 type C domain-containing protein n=1 Tax=Mangrovihabitans endophyticus TaxID=1751298 RepID=A0A8J3C0M0_9ACTN|nr:hypothetical protein GCM10012284_40370 [Mangrovihabitans endophyticus]
MRNVAIVATVATVGLVPLGITVTASAATAVLISAGRPALASSTYAERYAAAHATDGSLGSRWASVSGGGTQWLRIDLGGVHGVSRVRLTWERAYATGYRIQTSNDGASWSDTYVMRSGNGGTDDLRRLHGRGRFLRVLATQRATRFGYSLREVQVYGSAPASRPGRPSSLSAAVPSTAAGLEHPARKEIALQLVSTAENSTRDWRGQYGYIEDIGDGRGYTAGLVGFCSGTSDMLIVVTEYTRRKPDNPLAKYLPALRVVDGSDSHAGLDPGFPADWRAAAQDPVFQKTQEDERDRLYLEPALALSRADGLRALGQFAYFDAAVMHGVSGLRQIRAAALRVSPAPKRGGDEVAYLNAFLDMRVREMRSEAAHHDTSRVDTAQRAFLRAGNLDLNLPLSWAVYGDDFQITRTGLMPG